MKLNQQIKTILPLAAAMGTLTLAAGSAHAAVTSIDINTTTNSIHSGEADNPAGLQLPGQVGAWNSLDLGVANGAIITTTQSVVTSEGPTFTFNCVPGAGLYSVSGGTGGQREGGVAVDNRYGDLDSPVAWELTGLTPNGIYDFIFYSGGGYTAPNILIGTDSGTRDADGDSDFTSIVADGAGQISGTMEVLGEWQSLGAIQFEQTGVVPEPTTTALLGLGGLALILRRRK